ncbi:hypothetical protein HDU82_001945 [Entophlyctis luteolus]|nr:hypothetical protein HDU82_001945 [Entophlyctis luteolus]
MDPFSQAVPGLVGHPAEIVHHDFDDAHPPASSLADADATATHPSCSRIVAIAIDSSIHAEYTIKWAVDNFLKSTDLVVLLNARPFVSPPGTVYMDVASYIEQQEEFQRSTSHNLLRKVATKLKLLNFAVKAIALKGDVRDEIVRKTKEVHADILIVGSRGLGFLSRQMIGSVSDYCIHYASCPVLVVKPTEEDLKSFQPLLATDSAVNMAHEHSST